MSAQPSPKLRVIEATPAAEPRYAEYGEIASGNTTSVRYGRWIEASGFSRAIAIKRLHSHFVVKEELATRFVDESRLAMHLAHANIVQTVDVIEGSSEVALVLEYVHGESLWTLLSLARAQKKAVPLPVACSVVASILRGLHAAHETRARSGESLGIVHRAVSPHHVLLDSDGVPRLFDFGIAKAFGQMLGAPQGELNIKVGYRAPEQLHGKSVDRRTDVYAASAVLWEMLTGTQLFQGASEPAILHRVLYEPVVAPSRKRTEVPAGLDAIVLRGLHRDAASRFPTALEMAVAIERETRVASQSDLANWLNALARDRLAARAQALTDMEERGTRRPQLREISAASRHRLAAEQIIVPAPMPAPAPKGRARTQRMLWGLSAIAALGSIGLLGTPAGKPDRAASREEVSEPASDPQPAPQLPQLPLAMRESAVAASGDLAHTAVKAEGKPSAAPPAATRHADATAQRRDEANAKAVRPKSPTWKRVDPTHQTKE